VVANTVEFNPSNKSAFVANEAVVEKLLVPSNDPVKPLVAEIEPVTIVEPVTTNEPVTSSPAGKLINPSN
jgi:hypothetical protein